MVIPLVTFFSIQIKNIFRSIPEIRHVYADQTAFDEKLYALTRVEPMRAKEKNMFEYHSYFDEYRPTPISSLDR